MLRGIAARYIGGCHIIVTKSDKEINFITTGFLCSANGHIMTCAHAIDLQTPLFIARPEVDLEFQPPNSKDKRYIIAPLRVVQYDPINDVALLKADGIDVSIPHNHWEHFGDEREVPLGASVGYIGYPFASKGLLTGKISSAIISAKVLGEKGTRTLQIDSSVNDGNSGGPLIDVSSGKIVGIVSGRYSPSGSQPVAWIGGAPLGQESNISFAIGISYGIELMKADGLYA
ncbi:serine protease [Pseudomonas sp. GM17]|uniref:S1 family peptidase n=1 Tax=Pseudomonas sp. GM17 TaxID=1144323 RepID=UPI0002727774|nr:serine protease [Pseudomonas sp. GM17]WIE52420.1 serine protease [Pseudomonas sp. GM17]